MQEYGDPVNNFTEEQKSGRGDDESFQLLLAKDNPSIFERQNNSAFRVHVFLTTRHLISQARGWTNNRYGRLSLPIRIPPTPWFPLRKRRFDTRETRSCPVLCPFNPRNRISKKQETIALSDRNRTLGISRISDCDNDKQSIPEACTPSVSLTISSACLHPLFAKRREVFKNLSEIRFETRRIDIESRFASPRKQDSLWANVDHQPHLRFTLTKGVNPCSAMNISYVSRGVSRTLSPSSRPCTPCFSLRSALALYDRQPRMKKLAACASYNFEILNAPTLAISLTFFLEKSQECFFHPWIRFLSFSRFPFPTLPDPVSFSIRSLHAVVITDTGQPLSPVSREYSPSFFTMEINGL